jgi:hypothetical protein
MIGNAKDPNHDVGEPIPSVDHVSWASQSFSCVLKLIRSGCKCVLTNLERMRGLRGGPGLGNRSNENGVS